MKGLLSKSVGNLLYIDQQTVLVTFVFKAGSRISIDLDDHPLSLKSQSGIFVA